MGRMCMVSSDLGRAAPDCRCPAAPFSLPSPSSPGNRSAHNEVAMKPHLALALSLLGVTPGRADGLKAGAAAVDVTPPTGYAMWGYAARRDAASTGVMDRLQARALVLETG